MLCETCGKEHDGTYGSGRFCSKSCACKFSTKNDNNKELKLIKCIDCGQYAYVNKRTDTSKCRCKECKEKHITPSHIRKCSICGRTYLYNTGGCKNKFCQTHNIQQFKSLIKYFTFDKTKLGTLEVEDEFNRVKNLLYDLYWNKKLTANEIGKIYNYKNSHNIIQNIFKFLKIPTRNLSESQINAVLQGKKDITYNFQYKNIWHTTWNNKEVYLRSSYELDYAKELDEQQIDYEVEKLRIKYFDSQKNKIRCAVPDFYLPNENMIIEIKSSWTTNYQELKDKENEYKKLGYNYKLIFEHKEYNTIDDIDKLKYVHNQYNYNQIDINRIYKQKEGYNWIYKDNIQLRCNKNETEQYLNNGWKIGRLK